MSIYRTRAEVEKLAEFLRVQVVSAFANNGGKLHATHFLVPSDGRGLYLIMNHEELPPDELLEQVRRHVELNPARAAMSASIGWGSGRAVQAGVSAEQSEAGGPLILFTLEAFDDDGVLYGGAWIAPLTEDPVTVGPWTSGQLTEGVLSRGVLVAQTAPGGQG